MRSTDDFGTPIYLEIWRMERCVSVVAIPDSQNQLLDGRYVVFSAGRSWPATPLLPISRPCFP